MKRVDQSSGEIERLQGIVKLLQTLEGMVGVSCAGCGTSVCGHDAVANVVLGVERAPRCIGCLAHAFERGTEEMKADLLQRIGQRRCYSVAWAWAARQESGGDQAQAPCLWRAGP